MNRYLITEASVIMDCLGDKVSHGKYSFTYRHLKASGVYNLGDKKLKFYVLFPLSDKIEEFKLKFDSQSGRYLARKHSLRAKLEKSISEIISQWSEPYV